MVLTYLACKMKTELHFVWLSYVTLVLRATACQATVAKERGIEAARLQVEQVLHGFGASIPVRPMPLFQQSSSLFYVHELTQASISL